MGRGAVAYLITYLVSRLTIKAKQAWPAGPLELCGIHFQAMKEAAGCQHRANRSNYIVFRERTENTPPPPALFGIQPLILGVFSFSNRPQGKNTSLQQRQFVNLCTLTMEGKIPSKFELQSSHGPRTD